MGWKNFECFDIKKFACSKRERNVPSNQDRQEQEAVWEVYDGAAVAEIVGYWRGDRPSCRPFCRLGKDPNCPHWHSPPPFGDCGAFLFKAETFKEANMLLERDKDKYQSVAA